MTQTTFSPIDEILDELRAGKMVVLVDGRDRENEGDLVCAAEKVTPDMINFMLRYARGVLCLALPEEHCKRLHLHDMSPQNTAQLGTAFTVTIDASSRFGVSTGVSASDRATTILRAVDDQATADDFDRPGHINPLKARNGGVLVRAGQTEGSVDLTRLADMKPAAVIIEVMNDDGTMARVPELTRFCSEHGLKMCTVQDLIEYRLQREKHVLRLQEAHLPTKWGDFRLISYRCLSTNEEHIAVVKGDVGRIDEHGLPVVTDEPTLVRVHSECLTGDVFGSMRCDCGEQVAMAMQQIEQAGRGAVVYLRQEGRGIGIRNKVHAYALQDRGYDTSEANLLLGFAPDRRDYGIGAQILRDLGIRNLRLLTNNPKKVDRLEIYGLTIVEQIPVQVQANKFSRTYLSTKKERFGHALGDV